MAALVASQRQALVRRLSGMRSLLINMRQLSSHDSKTTTTDHVYHEKGDQDGKRVWPDRELLFNPYDQMKYPLPGNMSPAPVYTTNTEKLNNPILQAKSSDDIDILNTKTRYQNQTEVMGQYSTKHNSLPNTKAEKESNSPTGGIASLDVELQVQDCPLLMRKDFQQLFPGSDVMTGDFTVVSLCQKTEHDMSGWSEMVEVEREALIALYTETAKELCSVLHNAGFWADFIDPCSGKPTLGAHTTDSMFETDDRYRYFGFEIEDLGCCKVIKHHKWGTKAFVGCIFTNASVDSPVLVELTEFTQINYQ